MLGMRKNLGKQWARWVVVVAHLVERSLLTPEVRGSNPVIGNKNYIEHLLTFNCIEKTKIKKKYEKQ